MNIVPQPIKKGIKWVVAPAFNVKSWVGWNAIKDNTKYVTGTAKQVFTMPAGSQRVETFEEAVGRLHLSDAQLKEKQHAFLRIAVIIGLLGLFSLLYTFYMLWYLQLGGALLAFTVTLLCFATAMRYHFWYFQVKNRKLGCTWREWIDAKVMGDGK